MMKLMTKEIEKKIPPMDSVDSENPKIFFLDMVRYRRREAGE